MSPLIDASRNGNTELVQQLLLDGAQALDEQDEHGMTALMYASARSHPEVVKLLLDSGASVDEMDRWSTRSVSSSISLTMDGNGWTALKLAKDSSHSKTAASREVLALLVERRANNNPALLLASLRGETELVQQQLDTGALLDEKDEDGWTALMWASFVGNTDMVKMLLDKGASADERGDRGETALLLASRGGYRASLKGHDAEVVTLLLEHGASVDEKDKDGFTALPTVVAFDEDELGRMAAALVHWQLQGQGRAGPATKPEVESKVAMTAKVVLQLVRLAGFARDRARKLRSSDPRSADDHQVLFARLQLVAAACVQSDEFGQVSEDSDIQKLFRSDDGRKALEHAVQIEAKELLAQTVVQGYMQVVWRGPVHHGLGWAWVRVFVVLLLNLLFVLPLVALAPSLDCRWSKDTSNGNDYLLRLPIFKFALGCAADLALVLVLFLYTPGSDLATASVAPLLLTWVGSGLLWEARQLMASRSDSTTPLARLRDRFVAYWGDTINRVDATALIFSLVALIASLSTDYNEHATATSLRAVAVLLLWFRLVRVLLISPRFGPFVLMFFRILFGDLLNYLVLQIFLLVGFAFSYDVLLDVNATANADCLERILTFEGGDIASKVRGWLRMIEAALRGGLSFECFDPSNSPVAALMIEIISLMCVILSSVLLINMLIAMCAAATGHIAIPCLGLTLETIRSLSRVPRMAKTFDNISEASATNYLFLFAQRTLALQSEAPTPPPLNALGLPCHAIRAMLELPGWLRAAAEQKTKAAAEAAAEPAAAPYGRQVLPDKAGELAETMAAAGNAQVSAGSVGLEEATQGEGTLAIEAISGEEATAVKAVAVDGQVAVAAEASPSLPPPSPSPEEEAPGEETPLVEDTAADFAEKIAPLAKKITTYILDHQDDSAQEERWRTTMKRDMSKNFRLQREAALEAAKKQRELIDSLSDKQRDEMQSMEQRVDDVHTKLDETIQLVRNLANPWPR